METNQATSPEGTPDRRWSQQRRLRFIDFRLQWDGTLNRRHLCETFQISVPQASKDIGDYIELWDGDRLEYDKSQKNYVATSAFTPAYTTSGPTHYFAQLLALDRGIVNASESFLGFRPPVDVVPVPTRAADEGVLKQVVHAIRDQKSLEIDYQSIARDEVPRRAISPHAFGHDGLRWHVRAYCHLRQGFRDFVVGRITRAARADAPFIAANQDEEWNHKLTLVLTPHPDLSGDRRRGVESDYQMQQGCCELVCRQAMLYYVLRSLNLDHLGQPHPGVPQVTIKNLADLAPYLPKPGQH